MNSQSNKSSNSSECMQEQIRKNILGNNYVLTDIFAPNLKITNLGPSKSVSCLSENIGKLNINANSGTSQNSTDLSKSTRTASVGTANQMSEGINSASSKENSVDRKFEGSKKDFTQIMFDRWHRSNVVIPQIDLKDIFQENPNFNNYRKICPEHQNHPEYTQQAYLRIRSLEEAFTSYDYLLDLPRAEKLSLSQRIQQSVGLGKPRINYEKLIDSNDRSYGIQKIFDLHTKKDYKGETLFIASGIFDRYIQTIGVINFKKQQVIALATISLLMSAKLEQPISPSFSRMISLLTDEEQKLVSKKELIDLEENILVALGFDFNFPGPVQSMERYLRILNYDLNRTVYDMSFQITKFQLNDSHFLTYKPSMIAACSIILAINIFERDSKSAEGFFKNCQSLVPGMLELNIDIWNNQTIHSLSGYSIEDLKQCLFALAQFISKNLQPNRLEGFNIESIPSYKMYEGF